MKKEDIKKQIMVETGIIAAGLVLLGAIIYFLSSFGEDYAQEMRSLQAEVNKVSNAASSLQNKYAIIAQSRPLYEEAMTRKQRQTLSVSREFVRQKFNQFNKQYHLSDLKLVMGGIETLPDPQLKTSSIVMISSAVNTSANALSDTHVFQVLNALQQELSGSVKMTKFSLTRKEGISDDLLRSITQSGPVGLVKAQMEFSWYGLQFNETPSDGSANASKSVP